ACSRFISRRRGSGIYLSIADNRDGDALRQHYWRSDFVRQRLGSGVPLLSSEVQLLYSRSAQCRGRGILVAAGGDCEQGRCGRDEDERVTRRPKWPLIGWWRRQRRSPEHPAQSAHIVCAASDCRAIAIYEYEP